MLPGTGPKVRHQRNLLDKLASDTKFEGPLSGVRQLMVDRRRCCVYTRNANGIDGHLIGFIEMFDKHWNLVLSDVLEVQRRRRPGQCAVSADAVAERLDEMSLNDDFEQQKECQRRLRALGLSLPAVKVRALNRKWIEVRRHLVRAMVRGEQVVLVTASNANPPVEATAESAQSPPPSRCDRRL